MPILRSASPNRSNSRSNTSMMQERKEEEEEEEEEELHGGPQSHLPSPSPSASPPPQRRRSLRLSEKVFPRDPNLSRAPAPTRGRGSRKPSQLSPAPVAPVTNVDRGEPYLGDIRDSDSDSNRSPRPRSNSRLHRPGRGRGKSRTGFSCGNSSIDAPATVCDITSTTPIKGLDSTSEEITASNKWPRFCDTSDVGASKLCGDDEKLDKSYSHQEALVGTSGMSEDVGQLETGISHRVDLVELDLFKDDKKLGVLNTSEMCKHNEKRSDHCCEVEIYEDDKLGGNGFLHKSIAAGTSETYQDDEKVAILIDLRGEASEQKDETIGASNTPDKKAIDGEKLGIDVEAEEAQLGIVAEGMENGGRSHQEEAGVAGPSVVVAGEGDHERVFLRANRRGRRNRAEVSRARFLQIARERAFHFAHFDANGDEAVAGNGGRRSRRHPPPLHHHHHHHHHQQQQQQQPGPQVAQADWPGPFSTARQLVENRALAAAARQNAVKQEAKSLLVEWHPRDSADASFQRTKPRPSLQDLCLQVLSSNAEHVASLEGVPEFIRTLISVRFCEHRKMDAKTLSLFFQGAPTEIRAPDCTQVPEAEMTEMMGQLSAEKLEELHLGFCGRALSEKCLLTTICKSSDTYPLKSISLRGAYRLTDKGLESLLQCSPQLLHLDLSSCSFLTNTALKAIVRCTCGTLESLVLDGCTNLNAESIVHDLVKLQKLEKLSLSSVSGVTDEVVSELCVQMGGQLRDLCLAHCISLTDAAIAGIGACCPSLRQVNLSHLSLLTDIAIAHITDGLRALQALDLRRCNFSDEGVAAFVTASGGSLVNLSLNSVHQAGEHTVLALARHSNGSLQQLDMSFCRSVTDECLGFLADCCPQLTVLKLFGCTQITEKFLKGHRNHNLTVVGV